MKPLKATSFWGSLSALALLQIMEVYLFHAISFFEPILLILNGWFILFLLKFQINISGLVRARIFSKPPTPSIKDILKIILGVVFVGIWYYLIKIHYPFPTQVTNSYYPWIFSLLTLFISFAISTPYIKTETLVRDTKKENIAGNLFIYLFCIVGFAMVYQAIPQKGPLIFYLFGSIPLGTLFILFTTWLISD